MAGQCQEPGFSTNASDVAGSRINPERLTGAKVGGEERPNPVQPGTMPHVQGGSNSAETHPPRPIPYVLESLAAIEGCILLNKEDKWAAFPARYNALELRHPRKEFQVIRNLLTTAAEDFQFLSADTSDLPTLVTKTGHRPHQPWPMFFSKSTSSSLSYPSGPVGATRLLEGEEERKATAQAKEYKRPPRPLALHHSCPLAQMSSYYVKIPSEDPDASPGKPPLAAATAAAKTSWRRSGLLLLLLALLGIGGAAAFFWTRTHSANHSEPASIPADSSALLDSDPATTLVAACADTAWEPAHMVENISAGIDSFVLEVTGTAIGTIKFDVDESATKISTFVRFNLPSEKKKLVGYKAVIDAKRAKIHVEVDRARGQGALNCGGEKMIEQEGQLIPRHSRLRDFLTRRPLHPRHGPRRLPPSLRNDSMRLELGADYLSVVYNGNASLKTGNFTVWSLKSQSIALKNVFSSGSVSVLTNTAAVAVDTVESAQLNVQGNDASITHAKVGDLFVDAQTSTLRHVTTDSAWVRATNSCDRPGACNVRLQGVLLNPSRAHRRPSHEPPASGGVLQDWTYSAPPLRRYRQTYLRYCRLRLWARVCDLCKNLRIFVTAKLSRFPSPPQPSNRPSPLPFPTPAPQTNAFEGTFEARTTNGTVAVFGSKDLHFKIRDKKHVAGYRGDALSKVQKIDLFSKQGFVQLAFTP
ncbi:hypothetical protein BDK51DRAFT_37436 [Blyttiomyces helicus]|uniref:Uncharacterized protein n=1 Tax=Blyttiomyces helicus TaxID=388810 RepID=A0A4P9W7K7_9FUNG|nr:hypothetical protein BDK51DRAFT_37436 [Blyttiomyces helicus]|eukprot:RKO88459.1 hypothetical protein BDK51DRAFT_37436 [Blyttiomyces helicus]